MIILDDGVRVGQQKALDSKYDNDGEGYADVAEANTSILLSERSLGLEVFIQGQKYWYKDGIADEDLVLFESSGGTQDLQSVLENGSEGNVETPVVIGHVTGNPADTSKLILTNGGATIQAGDNTLVISNDVAEFTSPLDIQPSEAPTHAVQRQEVNEMIANTTFLPKDFFISCNYKPFPVMAQYMSYITDTIREIDINPLIGGLGAYCTRNVLVIDNETIFITGEMFDGNFDDGPQGNPFILTLKNCRIKENILTYGSYLFTELPDVRRNPVTNTPNQFHAVVYHRNFIYITTRTPNTIVDNTQVIKINPFDLTDVKYMLLPTTGGYDTTVGEMRAYKNNLYLLGSNVRLSPANRFSSFIRVDENLTESEILFQLGNASENPIRLVSATPFEIYNDKVYIPYVNATNGTTLSNNVGIAVYDLYKKIRVQNVETIFSTGSTDAIAPHWLKVFNNCILLMTTSNGKRLFRFDVKTLALQENIQLPALITNNNSIKSDGYIYLNPELSSDFRLIKVKYNDFTDYQDISPIGWYSLGSTEPKWSYEESFKTKLSEFENDSNFTSTTYVDNADILKANLSGAIFTGDVQVPITPLTINSATSKSYVDNLVTGLSWKYSVKASTLSALPTYTVSGSNTILTATTNGALTLDGVILLVNDRVLVKNEITTNRVNNGIYVVTQVGDGSNPYILTRAIDANSSSELEAATVYVRQGSTELNKIYAVNVSPITLGTTQITFSLINGGGTYTNGSGLTLTGNVFAIDPAYTSARDAYADSKVVDAINDGVTSSAPTQNAVFDALALKQSTISGTGIPLFSGSSITWITGGAANTFITAAGAVGNFGNSVRSASLGGLVLTDSSTIASTDMTLQAFGKLQAQITALTPLTATATLDFPNTNAGMSSELTITVTGAADGDVVALGVPNASSNANSCYTARVSAANTVTVKFNNYSTLPINPASGTFKVKVFK